MSSYLDASVVVPLFIKDTFSARALTLLSTLNEAPLVSDWAALEVSNVVTRQARVGALSPEQAQAVLLNVDIWCGRSVSAVEISPLDVSIATSLVRRQDLTLRAADAVHIAIAQRLGATLCTFDLRMAEAAKIMNLRVA